LTYTHINQMSDFHLYICAQNTQAQIMETMSENIQHLELQQ
jgi:hypothetical protein